MPLPPRGDTNRNSTGAGMQRAGAVGAAAPGGSPSGHQPLTPQQQQFLMQQMYMQQQAKFARQNAGAPIIRRRDRNAGVITDEEWEEGVEHVDDRDGKSFRRLLLIMLAIAIVFLAFMKYEAEESFAIHPDMAKLAEREAELRGDVAQAAAKPKAAGSTADTPVTTAAADASSSDSAVTQEQIDEYYKLLNVEPSAQLSEAELRENVRKELQRLKDEATTAEEKAKLDGEDAYLKVLREQDKQRRLDEWRKLQTLKQNFNRHQEQYGQLVACGKQCESQHKQLQLAYDTLNGQVTRELFTTLLDENVLKSGRKSVTNEELKTAFEKKKEQIEASSETEEVKSMELAEIKDAYDVLQNPETRTYYLMFGRKPPEHMKKTSTRHGGWGQELLLRTHKNRLVLAWLDYFAASWADYSVLGIIGFFGFLLPVGMQLPRIIEMAKEIEERQIQMEELEKRAAEADAAGGAK